MKRYDEIENRLKQELESSVPDVYENIRKKAGEQKLPENVVPLRKPERKNKTVRKLLSAAAVLIVVITGIFAYLSSANASTFHVEIDVNPGVILEINKNKKVTDVITLNEDGKTVLDGMDLKGSNLDVAINALMFSIIKNGYLDEMTNSVLVTLSDSESKNVGNFGNEISESIASTLKASSIDGSVLVQTAQKTEELEALSARYHITVGKATLIRHLIDSNKTAFTFEQLSALSVNELNVLMSEKDITSEVTVTGSASRKAYIGETAATAIAYAAAGIKKEAVTVYECTIDLDDSMIVYDVEFAADGVEYECEIDALTGTVIQCEVEGGAGKPTPSEPENTGTLRFRTKEEIKAELLEKNSLTASECKNFEIELDYEDGIAKYEVEFVNGDTRYEYEVNAVNGKVISSSFETLAGEIPAAEETAVTAAQTEIRTSASESIPIPTEPTTAFPVTTTESGKNVIGINQAKLIALKHAGLDGKAVKASVEPERDDSTGKLCYQVEFNYGGFEYEYKIDAFSGDILDFEKEADD